MKTGIMIGVPTHDVLYAEFAQSLAMSCSLLTANKITVECSFNIGSYIDIARRNIVDLFMNSECSHLWWVDSDIKFPIDAPLRLLHREKDIVGTNHRGRRLPNVGFVAKKIGMIQHEFHEEPELFPWPTTDESPEMEQVDVLPGACTLVHRDVFEKIPKPHYLSWYNPETNVGVGEDVWFSQQAIKHGYELWLDHELSRSIGHIGTFTYSYKLPDMSSM